MEETLVKFATGTTNQAINGELMVCEKHWKNRNRTHAPHQAVHSLEERLQINSLKNGIKISITRMLESTGEVGWWTGRGRTRCRPADVQSAAPEGTVLLDCSGNPSSVPPWSPWVC